MNDWEEGKQEFIEKLSGADKTFTEIFKIDAQRLVIDGDNRTKLERLQAANRKILQKLRTREFTVAIVGLEKAGKSTLGNALIKSMVLPEYSERCTYTTTEIRAGNTDIAEIYFYSRAEFSDNFKRMLNDVEYPDDGDFFTMTLDVFNRYWSGVENNPDKSEMFHKHNGTTAEDIKAVLGGKNVITPLLGQPPMNFGAEYWTGAEEFNEFKVFITGMSGKNADGSVIRQPHPYAVKNVIIRSTQLQDMSNIVLYDVPGFDSPTEIHKRQTEEMLKVADAIILVTNVGDRPNLTGTQLDMLRKGHDADGIRLSAKAFVFGNKIDLAADAGVAQNNLAALTNESVNKYQIALPNHIVGGSARAYLERRGLISGEVASGVLGKWNIPDGIDALHEKMQAYYDNERFEVIKQRARNTIDEMQKIFNELLRVHGESDQSESDFREKTLMEIQSSLPKFLNSAKEITRNYIGEINAERPFTSIIEENLQTIYPLIEENIANRELITATNDSLGISVDGIDPITTIDGNVRDKLSKKFVENIAVTASKLTIAKQKELLQRLIDSFLSNMGTENAAVHRKELEESVDALFNRMLSQSGLVQGNFYCNFNLLVERFVTTLIQTLIATPFAKPERLQLLKAALDEFAALAMYYNMPTDDNARRNLRLGSLGDNGVSFIARIITHSESAKEKKPSDDLTAANREFLQNFFENNITQICIGSSELNIDSFPLDKWAASIAKAGINLPETEAGRVRQGNLVFDLRKYFYDSNWSRVAVADRIRFIGNIVNDYIRNNQQPAARNANADDSVMSEINDLPLVEQLDKLNERAKNFRDMQNEQDMIEILNADIEILRDITKNAVIKAIGLERAFISVVTKNVELIRENLQAGDGSEKFQEWIRKYAAKLKPSQFDIQEQELRKNRIIILHSIEVLLKNLEI